MIRCTLVALMVLLVKVSGAVVLVDLVVGRGQYFDGSAWKPLVIGGQIPNNAKVRLGSEEDYADFIMPDGSIVRVNGTSLVELKDVSSEDSEKKVNLVLGKLLIKAAPQRSGELVVSTPTAVAAVRGTVFGVSHFSEEGTKVVVFKGEVSVKKLEEVNGKTQETKEVILTNGEVAEVKEEKPDIVVRLLDKNDVVEFKAEDMLKQEKKLEIEKSIQPEKIEEDVIKPEDMPIIRKFRAEIGYQGGNLVSPYASLVEVRVEKVVWESLPSMISVGLATTFAVKDDVFRVGVAGLTTRWLYMIAEDTYINLVGDSLLEVSLTEVDFNFMLRTGVLWNHFDVWGGVGYRKTDGVYPAIFFGYELY